jgi:negative regulator of sigma E activity
MVTRNGATVAITRRIDADGEYFLATLVGEIPETTGQQIIRSIVHK